MAAERWYDFLEFGGYLGNVGYVAYQEGTLEQIANLRTQNFIERIRKWRCPAPIRIPLSVFVRLYPRPLNEGQPNMIENTMYLVSEKYGGRP